MKRIVFYCLIVAALLQSCEERKKVEKGVTFEMAVDRKYALSFVQYGLKLDIPNNAIDPITGRNYISFNYRQSDQRYLYLDFNATPDKLKKMIVNGRQEKIIFENEHIVIPVSLLKHDDNVIEIDFIAGDLSLNRNPDYLYTLFVPDRASTCFPSFDQPDIKASFSLELTVPPDWEVVSNQASLAPFEENEKKYYQFNLTQPLSTYQFAFAAGKFKKATDEETGMTMYYRETDSLKVAENLKDIFQQHKQSITWLEEYTNIKYPFLKFDFVLIPTFQYGGMEHPGSIFYRESSLILDKSASVNQRLRRASLIAHETAHMWFGNLVTMKWFNDVWLKEVFANFMAAKIVNPQFPDVNHDLRFLMAHYPSAYEIDRTAGTHPIQQDLDNLKDAGTLYGAVIYQKAPIMMRNLEALMGEENFKIGLQEYLKKYNYSNASWDDLIGMLGLQTDKDLSQWNTAWIKSSGMPTL
ncbi:MAG TPA: M1 family aminopeptidase, partial [Cyclobacteriaceae bacterium]|nr:M1 family aminopeptidase [Cyclobacteriaceae bacterium]